jgi:hypothetical protein
MEITATGDDVLSGVFVLGNNDKRIRFRKLSQTLNEFGKVRRVLGANGDSDDGRDGVLHHSDVVAFFIVRVDDGCLFLDDVIDTDESAGVTAGNILNGLFFSTHHEDGSLDTFDITIVLLSDRVLTTLDSNLHSGSDGSREDSTEGSEPGEILGGEHLRDEHAKFTVRFTGGDMLSNLVSLRTFIEVLDSVLLGSSWRGELGDDHFQNGIGGVDPFLHDSLGKFSSLLELPLVDGEIDFHFSAQLFDLIKGSFEDRVG